MPAAFFSANLSWGSPPLAPTVAKNNHCQKSKVCAQSFQTTLGTKGVVYLSRQVKRLQLLCCVLHWMVEVKCWTIPRGCAATKLRRLRQKQLIMGDPGIGREGCPEQVEGPIQKVHLELSYGC